MTNKGEQTLRDITVSVYRYNSEEGPEASARMQEYTLTIPAHQDLKVLDLLILIKADHDPSLSYRHSCREGVCGSDGMNINGKNALACTTPISLLGDKITLRPLPGMPVIRDLVVDMSNFYRQYEKVKPYLQNSDPAPIKERLQSPQERAKLDGLYECILCGCCSSSCPSYWWNPEKFVGPAGLLWANRFIQDSRDTATEERLDDLQDAYSLFRCRTILNCADVCPKDLNPGAAIGELRREMIEES